MLAEKIRRGPSVRDVHVAVIGALGGHCPACSADLFDEDAWFTGRIVQHSGWRGEFAETLPLCEPCARRFTRERIPREVVEAYHAQRRALTGRR